MITHFAVVMSCFPFRAGYATNNVGKVVSKAKNLLNPHAYCQEDG